VGKELVVAPTVEPCAFALMGDPGSINAPVDCFSGLDDVESEFDDFTSSAGLFIW
jgi:hypothetical protein